MKCDRPRKVSGGLRGFAVFQISVENAFDFLSPEYADLFSRSDATVFQHPFWLDRLYARLVPYRNAKPW